MPRKLYTAIILLKNAFANEYINIVLAKHGIKLLAMPHNVNQAIMLIEQQKPDIFICDDDFENTEIMLPKLKKLRNVIKVILIANDSKTEEIIEYFQWGILGILRSDSPPRELSEAIKTIQNNSIFISSVYKKSLEIEGLDINLSYQILTKREIEIMKDIAQGYTNIQIAEKLKISPNSINNHRFNIRKKLNLKGGKSELLQIAISVNKDYYN